MPREALIPELDLHGLGVKEALETTREFLELSRRAGLLKVAVIFGKGKGSPGGEGVLRLVVPKALETEWTDLVLTWRLLLDPDGRDKGAEVDLRAPGGA
jgi:DNA-nicking Smr family endonuclease